MDPFRSERLIYRAPEQPDDEALFLAIQQDPIAFMNSNTGIAKPQSKKSANEVLKHYAEEALLGVVICLPAPEPQAKPVPIGTISLMAARPSMVHHRHSMIGINITKPYQGQGYGSEVIRWALKWAFQTAGLHRVAIGAFAYNEGAVRLYEKLGFTREGVVREWCFHEGRFWDRVDFGMLEGEWREMQATTSSKA